MRISDWSSDVCSSDLIIRGLATSDKTAALAAEFVKRIGKTALDAEDAPGFIVNRILCPMINEAIFALGEGIGTVESIDAGMKLGANHPMGPLTLADFVGLDTLLAAKIGRASCGERVCQYGEITVVAV